VFNVSINGNRVLTDFDVFKEAGGYHKALVKQFTGIAPDEKGFITIDVQKGKTNSPQISGIEIIKDPTAASR
jgi:Malectin domain